MSRTRSSRSDSYKRTRTAPSLVEGHGDLEVAINPINYSATHMGIDERTDRVFPAGVA